MTASAYQRLATALAAIFLQFALPGCVLSKYQKANSSMPPAAELNLSASPAAPLEAFVNNVIVFHGPGSWKRDAYWDEYVLSVANRGPGRLTLLSVMLVDGEGMPVSPGSDWQKLESESRNWWDAHVLAQNLAMGAGTIVVTAGAIAAPVGVLLAYAALNGVAIGSAGAAFIAAPVAAVWLAERNQSASQQIAREFDARRLMLPTELAPHQATHASLFFRLTPSPRKVVLSYREAGRLREATIDLAILADLHRKPGTVEPPPVGLLAATRRR